MYALVNEMYDLRNRSYFDQRLLKVSEPQRPLTIGGGTVQQSKRGMPSATPKHNTNKQPLQELNERVILNSMDKKKTYYNSILEHVQPRFKFKPRKRKNQLDEEGYSVRDDLSSVEFSYGSRGDRYSSAKGKANRNLFQRAGKSQTPGTAMDEKQKVKLLVEEYFKEKDANDNNYTYSTTGDDY